VHSQTRVQIILLTALPPPTDGGGAGTVSCFIENALKLVAVKVKCFAVLFCTAVIEVHELRHSLAVKFQLSQR